MLHISLNVYRPKYEITIESKRFDNCVHVFFICISFIRLCGAWQKLCLIKMVLGCLRRWRTTTTHCILHYCQFGETVSSTRSRRINIRAGKTPGNSHTWIHNRNNDGYYFGRFWNAMIIILRREALGNSRPKLSSTKAVFVPLLSFVTLIMLQMNTSNTHRNRRLRKSALGE